MLQLPVSCTALHVGGTVFDDAAATIVCQLSQLVRLSWSYSPSFTDLGLQQLTALRQLTHLLLGDNRKLSYEAVGFSWSADRFDDENNELVVEPTKEVRSACLN